MLMTVIVWQELLWMAIEEKESSLRSILYRASPSSSYFLLRIVWRINSTFIPTKACSLFIFFCNFISFVSLLVIPSHYIILFLYYFFLSIRPPTHYLIIPILEKAQHTFCHCGCGKWWLWLCGIACESGASDFKTTDWWWWWWRETEALLL